MTDNIRLDTPIKGNYVFYNRYGIAQWGTHHTDVINNLVYFSYYSGMEIFMESYGGVADANSFIVIQNNTCDDYQDNGIYIHGVLDSNDGGLVMLLNNIVSESQDYGLHLCDPGEYVAAIISNTGYYSNSMNKNWEFEETNPVIETEWPWVDGPGYFEICYLDQDCNFVNAGYHFVEETELIGKTTDVNGTPDSGYVDIGFHYPNWDFSNAGDGNALDWDLTGNLIVDLKDFATFANRWRTIYDIDQLSEFAGEWLHIVSIHPNICVTVYGDPNLLAGEIAMSVSGYSYATQQIFILLDGQFVEELYDFDDGGSVLVDTQSFRNGAHRLKAVAVDANERVTLSNNLAVNFYNDLYCVTSADTFEKDCDYHIAGLCTAPNDIRAVVTDWMDNPVWTSSPMGGTVDFVIPGGTLEGQVYDLLLEQNISESWETVWRRSLGRKYEPNETYKYAIFLPKTTFFGIHFNCRKRTVAEIVNVCENRGIKYVVLYKGECNWGNFASVLSSSSISYAYMVAHGGAHFGRGWPVVQRTHFWLTGTHVLSYYDDDLPEYIKKSQKVQYMVTLGLGTTNKMRIVHVDCCSAAKYGDMAATWIDFSQTPILDQLFISWNSGIGMLDPDYDIWSRDIWHALGESGTTYWDAQQYAVENNDKGTAILSKVQYYGFDQVTFTNQGN